MHYKTKFSLCSWKSSAKKESWWSDQSDLLTPILKESPENISGALQHNNVAAFCERTDADGDLF